MDKPKVEKFVAGFSEWSKELESKRRSEGAKWMHFTHVTANLANQARIYELLPGFFKTRPVESEKIYGKSPEAFIRKRVKLMETYRRLVENHTDFREGELKGNESLEKVKGFFSDVHSSGHKGVENYVLEAEKRLKGRQREKVK